MKCVMLAFFNLLFLSGYVEQSVKNHSQTAKAGLQECNQFLNPPLLSKMQKIMNVLDMDLLIAPIPGKQF